MKSALQYERLPDSRIFLAAQASACDGSADALSLVGREIDLHVPSGCCTQKYQGASASCHLEDN
jgi:hypothetical protein